jgi:hypothetical protein
MSRQNDNYELRPEYDLSTLSIVPKGRFAPDRRSAKNLIVLDPELSEVFPDDKSVNDALRSLIEISRILKDRAEAV